MMWLLLVVMLAQNGTEERTLRQDTPFAQEGDCLMAGKIRVAQLEKDTGRRFSYTCEER